MKHRPRDLARVACARRNVSDGGHGVCHHAQGEVTLHTGDALSQKVKASDMAGHTDRYYRKLLGYEVDPLKKKAEYESMDISKLREAALANGIKEERFVSSQAIYRCLANLTGRSCDCRERR